ncbi:hypothetical protein D3C75_1093630 [compost metagenome]
MRLGAAPPAAAATHAAGHGEQGVEGDAACAIAEALGHHAEHQRVVEHLVVPGEVADRQQLDAGVPLQLPVLGAQLAANRAQAGLVQLALPVGFEGLLQLAVAADAREAEGVRQCHLSVSMWVMAVILDTRRHMRQTQ